MKKSILPLVAVVLLGAGSAFAAATVASDINASAYLDNSTAQLILTVDDTEIDCGTLTYSATGAPGTLPAGTPCTSPGAISTAHASVSGNVGISPFYVTLTDKAVSTLHRQVILHLTSNAAKVFKLGLDVLIDGANYPNDGAYFQPAGDTSDILITSKTGEDATAQDPGRYTGKARFFLSF